MEPTTAIDYKQLISSIESVLATAKNSMQTDVETKHKNLVEELKYLKYEFQREVDQTTHNLKYYSDNSLFLNRLEAEGYIRGMKLAQSMFLDMLSANRIHFEEDIESNHEEN